MSEFKIIETQEQLEEVLKDRLSREKKKHSEEMASLQARVAELEGANEQLTNEAKGNAEKYANYDTELADLRAKVTGYETASVKRGIAKELGLPEEMVDRIQGGNEDEWRADAESLQKYFRAQHVPPLAEPDGSGGGDERAEYRKMLQEMKGEN